MQGDEQLSVWITQAIESGGVEQCQKPPNGPLPQRPPDITDNDVRRWDSQSARMQIEPKAHGAFSWKQKLQDHCFILAVGERMVSAGVVLSYHSARLVVMDTLVVQPSKGSLYLQLLAGYRGGEDQPLHTRELDRVFSRRTDLE